MSDKLTISKKVDGEFAPVGELAFGPGGQASLTIRNNAPAGPELRKAWSEISAMPKVLMKWSELDPSDATGATRLLKGREVLRKDPDYPKAVADILSRKYGFFATPSDPS